MMMHVILMRILAKKCMSSYETTLNKPKLKDILQNN